MTLTLEAPLLRVPDYPKQGLLSQALDIIFPPTCVGCRKIGRWICDRCWLQMPWSDESECSLCGRRWLRSPCSYCERHVSWLESTTAVCTFENTAREAVHALKYHGRHAISGLLGRLMAQRLEIEGLTIITQVPLHASRRRERGYDQAGMLARHVAKALDLPYESDLLKRVRKTKQQVGLSAQERSENVKDAFVADQQAEGESILLVDDVFTTGATMDSAAKALYDAGAVAIAGVVFAKAPLGGDGLDEDVRG